jgi:hypothetical protein
VGKLTVEVEYTLPIPLLGKVAQAFIVRQNERELELALANLKATMEAQSPNRDRGPTSHNDGPKGREVVAYPRMIIALLP